MVNLSTCLSATDEWREGDIIKNPNTRQFVTYSDSVKAFAGTLSAFHYSQLYMIYCQNGNTIHISGTNLPADSMAIKVRGDGQWSPMPCLMKQATSVTEALSDYYDKAKEGDMLKSHNHFAYFSENKRWEGDLTTMRPGEGYLFRRMAPGSVTIRFYNRNAAAMPKRASLSTGGASSLSTEDCLWPSESSKSSFNNNKASTNMTMIARITANGEWANGERLAVYVNDELAGVAEPIDSLYFITIQSDHVGELRFEANGEWLKANGGSIRYEADSHHGTMKAPVILQPTAETGVYKIIENDHVIIIRNNERYDVTGKKL